MARITIEDCTAEVPNRFQLIQMAARRAKQLRKGARAMVQADENKAIVTSLREVAAGHIKPDEADAAVTAAADAASAEG